MRTIAYRRIDGNLAVFEALGTDEVYLRGDER